MKHVGKLAIIGALLKAVKTSCVRTMQGRTYLIKRGLFRWLLLHTYYKIDTGSCPKIQSTSSTPYHRQEVDVDVGLPAGKNLHAFKNIFLFVRTYRPFSLHFTQGYS